MSRVASQQQQQPPLDKDAIECEAGQRDVVRSFRARAIRQGGPQNMSNGERHRHYKTGRQPNPAFCRTGMSHDRGSSPASCHRLSSLVRSMLLEDCALPCVHLKNPHPSPLSAAPEPSAFCHSLCRVQELACRLMPGLHGSAAPNTPCRRWLIRSSMCAAAPTVQKADLP